jgi:hypothetical protein
MARRTANTSALSFIAKGPVPPPLAGGPPPPSMGEGQQWHANPHHGGYGKNKGKNKGYKPAAAPPAPTPHNPWTGAIQCGLCRNLPATASSDLAWVPAPMPTWRPPMSGMPPFTARLRMAPRLV